MRDNQSTAESYCSCPKTGREMACRCGEDDNNEEFEWLWDRDSKTSSASVSADGREVRFHMDYSCGTAAARGDRSMVDRQYFWEIKMTTPVYGTDMMVGVGTRDQELDAFKHIFCSMVGRDSDSWGFSYLGRLQHKGQMKEFGSKFGQGSIVGIYLDMWHGNLYFYKNRYPLGLAAKGLNGKTLYPMVSSTAARSGMRIIRASSFGTSLQFMCCQVLRRMVPGQMHVTDALQLPPGLRAFLENNLSWLLRPCELQEPARSRKPRKRRHSEASSAAMATSSVDGCCAICCTNRPSTSAQSCACVEAEAMAQLSRAEVHFRRASTVYNERRLNDRRAALQRARAADEAQESKKQRVDDDEDSDQ